MTPKKVGDSEWEYETEELTLEQLAEFLQWILNSEHGATYRKARMLTASGACAIGGSIELRRDDDGECVVVLE